MARDKKSFFLTRPEKAIANLRCRAIDSARAVLGNQCAVCALPDDLSLCHACRETISKPDICCQVCGLAMPAQTHYQICRDCLIKPPPYEKIHTLGSYEGALSTLIVRAKVGRQLSAIGALVSLLDEDRMDWHQYTDYALLAMPTPRWRLIQRGFNLPAIFAQKLSQSYRLSVVPSVAVTLPWSVPKQAKRNRQQRQKNQHHYQINQKMPPKIMIVEDVVTSGVTVSQLAKTLRMHGAKNVAVWSFSRSQ